MQKGENFMSDCIFRGSKNLAPNTVTGSGLAMVAMILTIVTQEMVFDIAGGVLTAAGLLLTGFFFGFQWKVLLITIEYK